MSYQLFVFLDSACLLVIFFSFLYRHANIWPVSRTGRLLPGDVQPVRPGCQAPSLPRTLWYISHACLFCLNTLQGCRSFSCKAGWISIKGIEAAVGAWWNDDADTSHINKCLPPRRHSTRASPHRNLRRNCQTQSDAVKRDRGIEKCSA